MLAIAGLRAISGTGPMLNVVVTEVIRGNLLPVVVHNMVVKFLEGMGGEGAGDIEVVMVRAFEVGGFTEGGVLVALVADTSMMV